MYGAKDELCEFETINYFTKKHRFELEVMETGEHYFHIEKQLKIFGQWLHKHID